MAASASARSAAKASRCLRSFSSSSRLFAVAASSSFRSRSLAASSSFFSRSAAVAFSCNLTRCASNVATAACRPETFSSALFFASSNAALSCFSVVSSRSASERAIIISLMLDSSWARRFSLIFMFSSALATCSRALSARFINSAFSSSNFLDDTAASIFSFVSSSRAFLISALRSSMAFCHCAFSFFISDAVRTAASRSFSRRASSVAARASACSRSERSCSAFWEAVWASFSRRADSSRSSFSVSVTFAWFSRSPVASFSSVARRMTATSGLSTGTASSPSSIWI